ncbi:MAG TPA: hypothetical protein VKU93_07705, partial [Terracidiphilus sp.]|nr:hypothetical protein [Terracidiphilus sp.]
DTWAAYLLNGELFVKRTAADPNARYPDFGCSFETFTNDQFLEVETLGPLAAVAPGKMAELVEHWGLFKNVQLNAVNDDELDRTILPLVESIEVKR